MKRLLELLYYIWEDKQLGEADTFLDCRIIIKSLYDALSVKPNNKIFTCCHDLEEKC